MAFTSAVLTEAYKVKVFIESDRFHSPGRTENIFNGSFWNLSDTDDEIESAPTVTKATAPETPTVTKAPSPIDAAYGTKVIDVIKAWLADEHRLDHVSGFMREATGDIVKLDMKVEEIEVQAADIEAGRSPISQQEAEDMVRSWETRFGEKSTEEDFRKQVQDLMKSYSRPKYTMKKEFLKYVNVYSVVPTDNHSEVKLGPVARGEISINEAKGSLALCFDVVFSIGGIRVDWLGKKDELHQCQLPFQHMASWLKGLYNFSSTHFPSYGEMWMFRDAADGTCKYFESNEAKVFNSDFRLTLFSMFKYGMPFYTYKFGVLPLKVIDEAKEVVDGAPQPKKTEFCDLCVKAKTLGELTLGEMVKELEGKAAADIVKVAARLTDWHAITLRDLFKNKRIWTDTQENIKQCEDLKAFVVVLLSWPCKDSSDLKCDGHAKVVQSIDKLEFIKDYGRFIGDGAANRRAMCPQFDMSWRWRTFGSQGVSMPFIEKLRGFAQKHFGASK